MAPPLSELVAQAMNVLKRQLEQVQSENARLHVERITPTAEAQQKAQAHGPVSERSMRHFYDYQERSRQLQRESAQAQDAIARAIAEGRLATAQREIARLREQLRLANVDAANEMAQAADAEALARRLARALADLEWSDTDGWKPCCPGCLAVEAKEVHRHSCSLGALLGDPAVQALLKD